MSTLRVNTLQDVAGTGQPAMPGAAKAWVNFNGTGTVAIRAAFNVTSITDNGVGNYTANFTTALVDASYTFAGFATAGATNSGTAIANYIGDTQTASACQFRTQQYTGTVFDPVQCGIAVHR